VRCIDAAREAARLAARGDGDATQAARTIAPVGADIEIHREAELVVATVVTRSILLPGITIRADTVAAMEPTAR
jgi:hypothetical protein